MQNRFRDSLVKYANKRAHDLGYKESEDLVRAAVMTLVDIVSTVIHRASHFYVDDHPKRSDAVNDATFLCLISSGIIDDLGGFRDQVNLDDLIAEAGWAIFQFVEEEEFVEIMMKGQSRHQQLLEALADSQPLRDFVETLYETLAAYIARENPELLDEIARMHLQLIHIHGWSHGHPEL